MTNRQNGVPMAQMMSVTQTADFGGQDETGSFRIMVMALIAEAYQRNVYLTSAIRAEVIGEFANQTFLVCYQSFGG